MARLCHTHFCYGTFVPYLFLLWHVCAIHLFNVARLCHIHINYGTFVPYTFLMWHVCAIFMLTMARLCHIPFCYGTFVPYIFLLWPFSAIIMWSQIRMINCKSFDISQYALRNIWFLQSPVIFSLPQCYTNNFNTHD